MDIKTDFKGIENHSIWYNLVRIYARFAYHRYYRNIYTEGVEHLPLDEPVILCPNHQNALMDPLAILLNGKTKDKMQPVFLARADIFKPGLVSKALKFFKIMPVYRIRDGASNLKQNEQIFERCIEILENKKLVGIFAEGTHHDKRRLYPLQKGVARMAFQAEIKNDSKLGLKVVTVGITYSNYWDFIFYR